MSTNSRGSSTCTDIPRASASAWKSSVWTTIKRLNPFLTTDNVLAAAWTHGRRTRRPVGPVQCARQGGPRPGRHGACATIAWSDIRPRRSGEWEVVTEQGTIVAEMVVNAAGCYARQVAAMVGADAPITNMQHHYVVTHPIPAFLERSEEIPVMRDSYTSGYFRQEQKSGLMGVYESAGLHEAWAPRGYPEWDPSNELFPDDLDRIAPWLERAIERMPIFGEVGIRRVINGAIPHTPDGAPLLGPAAGSKNFWMCCGTSFGIAQGGGCGKYLAQWMLHGDAEINMTEFDPRRFGTFADQNVRARQGVPGLSPDVHHAPARRGRDGRAAARRRARCTNARRRRAACTPRPSAGNARSGSRSTAAAKQSAIGATTFSTWSATRSPPCTSASAVLDLTGFAKYDISGADAEAFLNRVCANHVPRKVGGIALVHMLSPGGRILGEMTVSRSGRRPLLCAVGRRRRAARSGLARAERASRRSGTNRQCDRGSRRAGAVRSALARALGAVDRCATWQ